MSYYPPYKKSSNNVKVELDLTNYAIKADLKCNKSGLIKEV